MILLIDHFDSFVETLARYVREAGETTNVLRVDHLAAQTIRTKTPRALILSPGPGRPSDTPQTLDLFEAFPATPILGVCLGHQALAEAYGSQTARAPQPMHGRDSLIHHEGDELFNEVPTPFRAGRYHSLYGKFVPEGDVLPTAWDEHGTVMAARHRHRPHYGVQFHPESLLTPDGRRIIGNFLDLAKGSS